MLRLFGSTVNTLFSLVLGLALIIQLLFLLTGSIRLESRWFGSLWPSFEHEELKIRANAITLSLEGILSLKEVSVQMEGEQDPILELNQIQTVLKLSDFWNRLPYLKQFNLQGGTLYISRRHSPTGDRFPIAREIHFQLQRNAALSKQWKLKFDAYIENVAIHLTGDRLNFSDLIPSEAQTFAKPSLQQADGFQEQYNEFSKKWSLVYPWIQTIGYGEIDATVSRDENKEWIYESASAKGEEITLPDWGTLDSVEVEVNHGYLFRSLLPEWGKLSIRNYQGTPFEGREAIKIKSMNALFKKQNSNALLRIHGFGDELTWGNYKLDTLTIQSLWDMQTQAATASLKVTRENQSLKLRYAGTFSPVTGDLTIKGTLDPMVWLQAGGFQWVDELKWEKQPESLSSSLEVKLVDNQIHSAYFEGFAKDFEWTALPRIDRLAIAGFWDGETIKLDSFKVEGNHFDLSADSLLSIKNREFFLQIWGTLEPLPWSQELPDWWFNLWNDFSFHTKFPALDLTTRGSWGTKQRDIEVTGTIQAEDFIYRGVDVDQLTLQLTFRPGFLWLQNMRILTPEGNAYGNIWRNEAVPFDGISHFSFDLQSRLPPINLAHLIDEEVVEIVQEFDFTGSTFIHGRGTITTGIHPFLDYADCKLLVDTEFPVTVEGIPFGRITSQVHLSKGVVKVHSLNAKIANGLVHANAEGYFTETPERFSLNAVLGNADLLDFIRIWSGDEEEVAQEEKEASADKTENGANKPPSPPSKELASDEPDNSGKLQLQIQLKGPWRDQKNLQGKGNYEIIDGNFKKIQLLWFLSDILPLTTLEFDKIKGTFDWDRDLLHFPDMEIFGPTTKMTAKGDYSFSKNEIDFLLKVFYLQRAPLIRILSPVFRPFADLLEVRIWGDFNDPDWRFILDPRNLFF